MFGNFFIKSALMVCLGTVACVTASADEIPWPLAKDYSQDKKPIDDYIKKLGTITNSREVGDFRKKLRARIAEDEKIVAAGEKHPRYEQAKEEIDRYETFLGRMGHRDPRIWQLTLFHPLPERSFL